jgi:hypothetical protein
MGPIKRGGPGEQKPGRSEGPWGRAANPTFAAAAGFPAGANQKPFAYNAGLAEKG